MNKWPSELVRRRGRTRPERRLTGRPPNAVRGLLLTEVELERVDRSGHTQRAIAQMLGVWPGQWSALVHRRRALTPDLQARSQACPVFRRAAPRPLWERVERDVP